MNSNNEIQKKILDTTRHIKLWLTKNPDKPFGYTINEERLVAHRERHPHHRIEVVVDKSLISDVGLKWLEEFSKTYEIIISDIMDFESECNDLEKRLLKWGKIETSEPGGNLSSASDLYRYILLKHGIYSDFDVEINFEGIPDKIPCDHFIININQKWRGKRSHATLYSDSAFLAFPDPSHKVIQRMQQILNGYYENKNFVDIVKDRNRGEYALKMQVVGSTGPGALDNALNSIYCKIEAPGLDILRQNWISNKLDQDPNDDEVNLKNSILKNSVTIGYDNSWLPSGIEKMEEDEKNRINASQNISNNPTRFKFDSTSPNNGLKEKSKDQDQMSPTSVGKFH